MMRVKTKIGKQQNKAAFLRRLAVVWLCALLLVFSTVPVFAAPATMIEVTPEGENLFQAMENMLPGESKSSVFTVKNVSRVSADFYLMASSAVPEDFAGDVQAYEKSLEMLALLDMRVELYANGLNNSGTVLYEGKAHHQTSGGREQWLLVGQQVSLGEIEPGNHVSIKATVSVPASLDNTFDSAQGKFWWIFSSRGEEPVSATPTPTPIPPPSSSSRPRPVATTSASSSEAPAPASSSSSVSSSSMVPSSSEEDSTGYGSIGQTVVPRGQGSGTWSLLDLILAAVGLIVAVWQLVAHLIDPKRRRDDDDEDQDYDDQEDAEEPKERSLLFSLISILTGIGAVVVFIFTQDLFTKMIIVDKWTPFIAVLVLVQLIFTIINSKRRRAE